ncbi:hypothetical protein QP939_03530 [Amycolatopsis nalaikhensis]|uniref:Uncharacterized protein n=1 Tax=Amycolatopsis nalaikhensis TaxID=715472 RepID=A0ABY8XQ28_9PSEU|nr:hypothetical protein [Amycolatopsis sp. 2-2]WIV57770.1 hypothetical protein QP939_03530 [Amycolatopsis sp. 2-2]
MNTLLTQVSPLVPVHPAARQLLDQVAAAPATPLRLAVVAPGGYGKSVLLAALDQRYREAGIEALLVDDADRLGPDQLEELLTGADGPIVVAHRPAAVAPGWTLLQLGPLGVEDIARLMTTVSGKPADPTAAADLHARSGGVPRLAERALRGRLEEFRPELDELDDDVLRYLIAAEAGAGRNLDLLCALLDRGPDQLPTIVEGARATGLLAPDDTLLPLAAVAVRDFGPPARRLTTLQRLVELPAGERPAGAGLGPSAARHGKLGNIGGGGVRSGGGRGIADGRPPGDQAVRSGGRGGRQVSGGDGGLGPSGGVVRRPGHGTAPGRRNARRGGPGNPRGRRGDRGDRAGPPGRAGAECGAVSLGFAQ